MGSHGIQSQSRAGIRIARHHERWRTASAVISAEGRARGTNTRSRQVPAVAPTVASLTTHCRRTRPAGWRSHAIGTNLSLKTSAGRCKRISWNFFVDMHCLRMLTQVIQPRKSSRAMALKRPFSRVFSERFSQIQSRCLRQVTYLICLARCSLLVKLRLHGGNSVQKNRWPFFFFDGLPVSPSMLSQSELPSPSSESSMSIFWESVDCLD